MDELQIEVLNELFSKLVDNCSALKNSVSIDLGGNFAFIENSLKDAINKLFEREEIECIGLISTNNTDKILFGVNVNPTISDADLMGILLDTDVEPHKLKRCNVEIDLGLCESLDAREIAAYIVEEIISTMSLTTLNNVRAVLDILLTEGDEVIDIKQSVNYSQLLTFGIKDTIKKFASLIYKPVENLGINQYAEILNIKEDLVNCSNKIKSCVFDDGEVTDCPKLGVLSWTLSVYKDVETNYRMMEDMLTQSISLTGSELDKKEIERTLKSLRRALSEVITEGALLESMIYEAKGFSLFKSLKQNGLRAIEDDLYEFKIRLKTAETEEEAIYILRQVNTRISILEDYIANTDLSDNELRRWQGVIMAYRDLRMELSKKNVGYKKSYGVFVDYDKFDQIKN